MAQKSAKKHSVIKSSLLSQSLVQSAFILFVTAKIHLFCENKWFLSKSSHFFPHSFFLFPIFAVGFGTPGPS